MLLSLAVVKLLEAPSEIMRLVHKGRTSSTAESELYMRLWVWGGRNKGKGRGMVSSPHKAISVCRWGGNQGFGDRGQQRDTGWRSTVPVITHRACAVWREGTSSRSRQHLVAPLPEAPGREPSWFCSEFIQSRTAHAWQQVQGHG